MEDFNIGIYIDGKLIATTTKSAISPTEEEKTISNGGNWSFSGTKTITVEDNEAAYYWLVLYFATVYQWYN